MLNTEERQHAVDRVVLDAALVDTEDREDFLRRVTIDDPALLSAVRDRLQVAAALPSDFLAFPAAALLDAVTKAQENPLANDPDRSLVASEDRYELGETLGQGGMATVQLAFDRHLQRRVALKFLDAAKTSADRERFLAEARAQARVRHDHVLAIYDTGELADRPFIAMHWVDGGTLNDLPESTTVEEMVRLIRQAAEGLHAAHREGLVHRDVKPANLLMEEAPDGARIVRVSDFGIAFDSDQGFQGIAGTPAYLAPETLDEGSTIDRRVDVYGLGVTLFELLSGRLPFSGDSVTEILRQVRDEPADELSTLAPSVPRELVAIVHRCMAKEPELRYGSARALSEDLDRFLKGEPVEAVTSTAAYRLSKFVMRHRRLLTVAGIAAVLLLLTSLLAAGLGIEAQAAGERAQRRQGQAEGLISHMLGDLRPKLSAVGRLDVLDGVGQEALRYFAAVTEQELSDLELTRRSQALYQIGEVYLGQGKLDQALQPLEESLSGARALLQRDPTDLERLFNVGQSEFWVGHAYFERYDHAAARPYWQRYLDISEQLNRTEPDNQDYQLELAYAFSNLGSLARRVGDLPSAIGHFEKTLELNQKLVDQTPTDIGLLFELAASHNHLGLALYDAMRWQEARQQLELELEYRDRLLELAPRHLGYAEYVGACHSHLANLELGLGNLQPALDHLDEASEVFDRLTAHDPSNRLWAWNAMVGNLAKANNRRMAGQVQGAAAALAGVPQIQSHTVSTDPRARRLLAQRWMVESKIDFESGSLEAARLKARRTVEQIDSWTEQDLSPTTMDHLRLDGLLYLGIYHEAASELGAAEKAWRDAAIHEDQACPESSTFEHRYYPMLAKILLGELDASALEPLLRSGFAHPDLMAILKARGIDPVLLSGSRAPHIDNPILKEGA